MELALRNGTAPTQMYFSDAEKGVLPLGGLLVVPAVGALVYWYAGRRSRGARASDHVSRAAPFYSVMGGALLGQVICHIFLPAVGRSPLGAPLMTLFVLIGYTVLYAFHQCGRVCVEGDHMYASADASVDDDVVRDRQTGTQREYVVLGDLSSEEAAVGVARAADQEWTRRGRGRIAVATLVALLFVACMEGMELVYGLPYATDTRRGAVVALFLLNKALQSAVVFGGLVHAKQHERENRWVRFCIWGTVGGLWAVCVTLSVVPALLPDPSTPALVRAALESWPLGAWYAGAGGALLWVSGYYLGLKARHTDRQQTATAVALFVGSTLASWATSL